MLKSAIRDDDCVSSSGHKYLYRRIKEELPAATTPYDGKARVAREGKDLSIITYAATVWKALEAAEHWQRTVSRRGADLRSLSMDDDAIAETVKKDESGAHRARDTRNRGIAGEITARISERAFEWLDAPCCG